MMNCWKNIKKPGMKSIIVLKKDFVVIQCTTNYIEKLKQNPMRINLIQAFIMLKYQKKVCIVFISFIDWFCFLKRWKLLSMALYRRM